LTIAFTFLLANLFLSGFYFEDAFGQNLFGGGLGSALQGAQQTGMSSLPQCTCPVDHSCDNMAYSDMSTKIGGGGLTSGVSQGMGLQSLGGLTLLALGGRRRVFWNLFPSKPVEAPAPVGLSGLGQVQGGSYLKDPTMTNVMTNKLTACDQQTKPGGPFSQRAPSVDSLTSGNFNGISSSMQPQAMNAGQMCKETMNTQKDKCQLMKRQMCSFINGKLTDPSKLSCAFKDMMKTAGQVQAKDSGCQTADALIKNPANAQSILQNGAPGIAAALANIQG